MSRDVLEKIAEGKDLTEDEVQYARDRGFDLSQYQIEGYTGDTTHDLGAVGLAPQPMAQTGPAFPMPGQGGPGVFLTPDQLKTLKKDTLSEIAEAAGVEASGTKNEMVAALTGTGVEPESEEGEEEGS
jgi:hypothetical protein